MDSDEKSASIQKGESEKYYVKWWPPHTPGLPLNVQLSKGVVYSLHLSEQEEAAQDLESLGTPLPLHLAMAKHLTLLPPVYGMPSTLPLTGVLTRILSQAILQGRL